MNDLIRLKEIVNQQGEIPVDFKMGYSISFSTLSGNLPINNRIVGSIHDIPVNLKLFYRRVAQSPVNVRVEGMIGETEIKAELKHALTFSTLAGMIPINNTVIVHANQKTYKLTIPSTKMIGSSRGAKGSSKSKASVGGPKYVAGQMVDASSLAGGGGGGISQDTGIPIPAGLYGFIEDIEIDIRFQSSYYFDTGSGKTPINTRAIGSLRSATNANFTY